jgi:hypothetical protein
LPRTGGLDVLQETLQFSQIISSDKEAMIGAVKNDSIAFEYCSDDTARPDVTQGCNSLQRVHLVSEHFNLKTPILSWLLSGLDPELHHHDVLYEPDESRCEGVASVNWRRGLEDQSMGFTGQGIAGCGGTTI